MKGRSGECGGSVPSVFVYVCVEPKKKKSLGVRRCTRERTHARARARTILMHAKGFEMIY